MATDFPPIETGNLSREHILGLAAHELQRWEWEHKQNIQRQASGVGKDLILYGVALLIFFCGYVAGQYSRNLAPTGPSSAAVHETIKP
jgi:hypothetical protein